MAALAFYDLYFQRSYAFDIMPPDLSSGSRYIYTRAQDNDKAERAIITTSVLGAVDADRADPVVGRDDEIERVGCILFRRTKNCAALGLAQNIAAGNVPDELAGARILELDMGAVVAGTRDTLARHVRGALERRHQARRGGGRKGPMDAANILKPAPAFGRIRCVGATTSEEPALERQFQKVVVEEPSVLATIDILRGLKQFYQEHHGLKIQDDALVAAAHLAARYITGGQFPDKAIDLINEACSTAKMHKVDNNMITSIFAPKELTVGPTHITKVVSRWTRIPLSTLDQEEKEKVGFGQSSRPIGSFLFLGPLGSGSISRLIGGPRSYEEDGQLTGKIKRCPYRVILFDQVDKADPSIFKVFIQLLDDGAEYLTTRVAIENTINAGRPLLMDQVQKHFKPEFLNRLGEVVIFELLSHDELKEIVKIQMKDVIATVANKGVSLFINDAALDAIWSESYSLVGGTRPMRRWVEKNVMTILSNMLVNREACEGSTISIDAADDNRGLKYQILKKGVIDP
ncbi:hypothetical protein VPH35_069681 [Triticum aestivum]